MNLEADTPDQGEMFYRTKIGMPAGHPEWISRNLADEEEQYLNALDWEQFRGEPIRWPNGDVTGSYTAVPAPNCGEPWQGSSYCSACYPNHPGHCGCSCHRTSSWHRVAHALTALVLALIAVLAATTKEGSPK